MQQLQPLRPQLHVQQTYASEVATRPAKTGDPSERDWVGPHLENQRYSIATFRPSTRPVSVRPCRKAAIRDAYAPADVLLRSPITGIVGCCPSAVSGHAATAPPRSVMNSRRRISAPELRRQHCIGSNEYFDRG